MRLSLELLLVGGIDLLNVTVTVVTVVSHMASCKHLIVRMCLVLSFSQAPAGLSTVAPLTMIDDMNRWQKYQEPDGRLNSSVPKDRNSTPAVLSRSTMRLAYYNVKNNKKCGNTENKPRRQFRNIGQGIEAA